MGILNMYSIIYLKYMDCSLRIKCVLLGTGNSGKSSLVSRYIDCKFDNNLPRTIGCAFNIKKVVDENKTFYLEIWDTSGNEHYKSMLPMYYRNSDIISLCLDLSEPVNVEIIDNWINEIDYTVDITSKIIYIVGTKSDNKNGNIKEDLDIISEKYPEFEYIETSSKNNININLLFNNYIRDIIKREEKIKEKNDQYYMNNYHLDYQLMIEKETDCFNKSCSIN